MNIFYFVLFIFTIVDLVHSVFVNLTDIKQGLRHKRGLIFQGGGVNKMIFGAIYPLYLEDPIKWRQLNCGYNIQAQYAVPTSPLYPWNKWEGRTLKEARESFDKTGRYIPDESRRLFYFAMETFMNNRGKNGRQCLLRAICENAQIQDHHGIFSEILYTILRPGKEELDDVYVLAHEAGISGVNCLAMFSDCPRGDGFADLISKYL